LKRLALQRQPCLICWSCGLKESGAINLIHPSTLPDAGSHDFGGLGHNASAREIKVT
jgi:hypothetical protein